MNEFIPYLKAKKLLQNRLGATAEEIAAWVYMGPALGAESCRVKSYPTKHANLPAYRHWPCLPSTGLTAYTNANEFDDPPRFHFDDKYGDDYLAPLMGCWFKAVSIVAFQPKDRYITGQALRTRWQAELGVGVDGYILERILESRLMDFHPIAHGTKWVEKEVEKEVDYLPPRESALFVLGHVKAIETEDGIGSMPTDTGRSQADGEADVNVGKKETYSLGRIAAILEIARQFNYDPMSVPYGGKTKIERECLEKLRGLPHLFTEGTFKSAWQAARNEGQIDVQNVETYRGKEAANPHGC